MAEGTPWKGCRSLIAARGFKSLLLRSLNLIEHMHFEEKFKKFLTSQTAYDKLNKLSERQEQKEVSSGNNF